VKHDGPATAIRDTLKPKIDENDKLLVVRLSGEGAWAGFDNDCSSWLKNNL
jgi:type IV secretory pathway VirJ component